MTEAVPWFAIFLAASLAAWLVNMFVEWLDSLLGRVGNVLDVEVEP